MHRRSLLTAPMLAAPLWLASGARAQPTLTEEDHLIPGGDPGVELFLVNRRPEAPQDAAPGRTLLFVHGADYPSHSSFDLPLGGLSWMAYIAGRGFDVWCLDLRGFGRSSRPEAMAAPPEANPPLVGADEGLRDLAAAIAFIRERRGIGSLALMGHGWGAALAGRFAAGNPEAVARLVLLAPPWPGAPGGPDAEPAGGWRGLTQAEARSRWLDAAPEPARATLLPAGWFEHFAGVTWATDPEGLRRRPSVLRIPNGPRAAMREVWQSATPPFDAAAITAPSLVATGEWDRDAPPAQSLALLGALSNTAARRLTVLGAGTHMMMLERNRGALFQTVQAFLEETQN